MQITVTGFTASSLSLVAPADMEVGSDHHPLFLDGPFGWSSHLYSAKQRTIYNIYNKKVPLLGRATLLSMARYAYSYELLSLSTQQDKSEKMPESVSYL